MVGGRIRGPREDNTESRGLDKIGKGEESYGPDSSNIIHVDHLDHSITEKALCRAISRVGLKKPLEVRIVRRPSEAVAFLEFSSIGAAELVLERFQSSLFSNLENMSFLRLGVKKDRPAAERGDVNYVFLYFPSDPGRSLSVSSSRGKLDRKFYKLQDLYPYLRDLSTESDLVAVFVCLQSFKIFSERCKDFSSRFCGWQDLLSMTMSRLDPCYVKHVPVDPSRLDSLHSQHFPESSPDPSQSGSQVMKRIFSKFTYPERFLNWTKLNPQLDYLVLVIDVGLVRVAEQGRSRLVLGSLALKGEEFTWSCGLDLDPHQGALHTQSATLLGLTPGKKGGSSWVYRSGEDEVACVSEKTGVDQLLQALETNMNLKKSSGGSILTTLLEDDSLVYLVAAMKTHGLMKRFQDLLAGFAHLETLFKSRNICKKLFSLKFLDKYAKNLAKVPSYSNLEREPGCVLVEVGFAALDHILDGDLSSSEFIEEHCYALVSVKFNTLLGESVYKTELQVLSPEYCELRLCRGTTLDPGKEVALPLQVVPALRENTNCLFNLVPDPVSPQLCQVLLTQQRSNAAGVVLVKVRNTTRNKVRLPRGMYFGLAQRTHSAPASEDQNLRLKSPLVDLERLQIEPSSDESDESAESLLDLSSEDEAVGRTPNDLEVLVNPDMDLELMATEFLSNVDILKELSEQLTPEQPNDLPLDNWEELNPTFSSYSLDVNMTNLDEEISLVEPNLPLFDQFGGKDEPDEETKMLECSPVKDNPVEKGEDDMKMEISENVDFTDLAPLKVSRKVARRRESIPLEEVKPLVLQLKLIKEKIKMNSVEGDLSDQFPSLIGQDEYTPLYTTLIQYTGCRLQDIDYDFLDFGEKVYSEILNFGLSSLDELCSEVKLMHLKNKSAVLTDWIQLFIERFESLEGINDLNGASFDSMVTQWILLHFCDFLETDPSPGINTHVRDMIGYPSFAGVDIIEQEISHLQDSSSAQGELVSAPGPCGVLSNSLDAYSTKGEERAGMIDSPIEELEDKTSGLMVNSVSELVVSSLVLRTIDTLSTEIFPKQFLEDDKTTPSPDLDQISPSEPCSPSVNTDEKSGFNKDLSKSFIVTVEEGSASLTNVVPPPDREEKLEKIQNPADTKPVLDLGSEKTRKEKFANTKPTDEKLVLDLGTAKSTHEKPLRNILSDKSTNEKLKQFLGSDKSTNEKSVLDIESGKFTNEKPLQDIGSGKSSNEKLGLQHQLMNSEVVGNRFSSVNKEEIKKMTGEKETKTLCILTNNEENMSIGNIVKEPKNEIESKDSIEMTTLEDKTKTNIKTKLEEFESPPTKKMKLGKHESLHYDETEHIKEDAHKIIEYGEVELSKEIKQKPEKLLAKQEQERLLATQQEPETLLAEKILKEPVKGLTRKTKLEDAERRNPKRMRVGEPNKPREVPLRKKVVETKKGSKNKSSAVESVMEPAESIKDEKAQPKPAGVPARAPIEPDEDFCDLYLGVKMEATATECSVMIFNDDLTTNAVFRAEHLYINGIQADPSANVENLLKNKGEDQDLILVYIPNLVVDGVSTSEVSIPLSSWDDDKFFFSGFVLFLEQKDKYCVVFKKGTTIQTAVVPKNKIKTFEAAEDSCVLEPGLEVKLMVKPRTGSSQPDLGVRYRATLCIPNPEKRFYDLVELTHWAEKTKRHLADPDTLQDIEDSLNRRVVLVPVTESHRSFILIRGKDRKSSVDGYNKIMETKTGFEQLPGNRPKYTSTLEVFMDCIPVCPGDRPASLHHLQHIAHYTGTTLRLQQDELSLEGYSSSMVKLARTVVQSTLLRPAPPHGGSVVSSSGQEAARPGSASLAASPPPLVQEVPEEDEVTSTTTEAEAQSAHVAYPDVLTVEDDEESTLKQIFYSQDSVAPPAGAQRRPRASIELKLGKNLTLSPGEERSITLSLKQRLTGKYVLHTHTHFHRFQDKLEMVMELINGSNVQLDLRNTSLRPLTLSADQLVVLLEERVPRDQEKGTRDQERRVRKAPMLMKKKHGSEGGIKNPVVVNRSLKAESQPSQSEGGVMRHYAVVLQEAIDIPGKSVVYAQVIVENGDEHVYNSVHELRRHQDFKNNAIFIPERQKKEIRQDKKLHMSIRNRLPETQSLMKGETVGQIIVQVKSATKWESPPKTDAVPAAVKKRRLSGDGKRSPPADPAKPAILGSGSSAEKNKILALLKLAITDKPAGALTATAIKDGAGGIKVVELEEQEDTAPRTGVGLVSGPCDHGELRAQACKAAILGNTCGNQQCLSSLQHTFPAWFLAVRDQEFCISYLTRKYCAKSFAPFVCPARNHVYDVGQLCRFYETHLEESRQNCISCRNLDCQTSPEAGEASAAAASMVAASSEAFVASTAVSIREVATAGTAEELGVAAISGVAAKFGAAAVLGASVTSGATATSGVAAASLVTASRGAAAAFGLAAISKASATSGAAAASGVTLALEAPSASGATSALGAASGAAAASEVTVVSAASVIGELEKKVCNKDQPVSSDLDVADAGDDIQIIETPELAPEPCLRLKCPHNSLNPTLCSRIGFCTDKNCSAAHSINSLINLKYCSEFLRTSACGRSAEHEPHLQGEQLQELYSLSLKRLVLNCRKCSFNCKLFNPTDRRFRQERICFKEYTANCRRKAECNFIHFQELEHLKMPPACKTFALNNSCPRRGMEKGVVHMSHTAYQNNFLNILKKKNRQCQTCLKELDLLWGSYQSSREGLEISNQSEPSAQTIDVAQASPSSAQSLETISSTAESSETTSSTGQGSETTSSTAHSSKTISETASSTEQSLGTNSSIEKSLKTISETPIILETTSSTEQIPEPSGSTVQRLESTNFMPNSATTISCFQATPIITVSNKLEEIDSRVTGSNSPLVSRVKISTSLPGTGPKTPQVSAVESSTSLPTTIEAKHFPSPGSSLQGKKENTTVGQDFVSLSKDVPSSGNSVSVVGSRDKDDKQFNKQDGCENYRKQEKATPTNQPQPKITIQSSPNQELESKITLDQMVKGENKSLTNLENPPEQVARPESNSVQILTTGNRPNQTATLESSVASSARDREQCSDKSSERQTSLLGSPFLSSITTSGVRPPEGGPTGDLKSIPNKTESAHVQISEKPAVKETVVQAPDTRTNQRSEPRKDPQEENRSREGSSKAFTSHRPSSSYSPSSSNPSSFSSKASPSSSSVRNPEPGGQRICPYYGTVTKCSRGKFCRDIHDLSQLTCRFWRAGHCSFGSRCIRKHSF